MQGAIRRIRGAIVTAAVALAVAALVQQVRRPNSERTWHGKILGVPYDFRRPTLARLREKWWNRNGPLLTPHTFGVGWSLNLYRLTHRKPVGPEEQTTSGG
jgi:hypothetical protein